MANTVLDRAYTGAEFVIFLGGMKRMPSVTYRCSGDVSTNDVMLLTRVAA